MTKKNSQNTLITAIAAVLSLLFVLGLIITQSADFTTDFSRLTQEKSQIHQIFDEKSSVTGDNIASPLFPTQMPTPTSIAQWKMYINEFDGMTVQYPAGWYAWREGDEKVGKFHEIEVGQFDKIYSIIHFYPDYESYLNLDDNNQKFSIVATGWTKETLYEGSKPDEKQFNEEILLSENDEQVINGLSISSFVSDMGGDSSRTVVFSNNDRSYILKYSLRDDAIMQQVINSIYFTK